MPLASLQDVELRILHWITCDLGSPLADDVMALANDILFGAPFFVLLLLLYAARRPGWPRYRRLLLTLVLSAAAMAGIKAACWRFAPRDRPGDLFPPEKTLQGPIARETCASMPDLWVERGYPPKSPSFPSSHTATAAVCAAAITCAWWPLGIVAWVWAAAVGWARLYLGKHWPTDVLGTMLLCALVVALAWRLAPRIDGAVVGVLRRALRRPPPPRDAA